MGKRTICHSDPPCLATVDPPHWAVLHSCLSKPKAMQLWTMSPNIYLSSAGRTAQNPTTGSLFLFGWLATATGEGGHAVCILFTNINVCHFSGRRRSRQQWPFQQHTAPGESRRVWCNYWPWLAYSRAAQLFLSKPGCSQGYLWPSRRSRRQDAVLSEISQLENLFAEATLRLWIGRSWLYKREPTSHPL